MFTSNYFGLYYAINIITSNRPILDLTCCCNYHQKYTWEELLLESIYHFFLLLLIFNHFNLFPLITLKIGSIVQLLEVYNFFFISYSQKKGI